MTTKVVGVVSEKVRSLLRLDEQKDNAIYCGPTNYRHMISKHPDDYARYGAYLEDILSKPDYVGKNPTDGSIEYVKTFQIDQKFVKVAVRLSGNEKYYARSLYVLNAKRVSNYIQKGKLFCCIDE